MVLAGIGHGCKRKLAHEAATRPQMSQGCLSRAVAVIQRLLDNESGSRNTVQHCYDDTHYTNTRQEYGYNDLSSGNKWAFPPTTSPFQQHIAYDDINVPNTKGNKLMSSRNFTGNDSDMTDHCLRASICAYRKGREISIVLLPSQCTLMDILRG